MAKPQITPAPLPSTPPLHSGQHLTRDEFERRYAAMPHIKKAELIEGVVYMPSPVRFEKHSNPHATLIWWLTHFAVFTPGVRVGANGTVRLDLDNEPQPDGLLIVEPKCGGRAAISADDYIEGAPDLVAEVAASSASFDLHTKLRAYCRNEVREYVVWRVLDGAIDWFVLRQGAYVPLPLSTAGFYQSEVFPGLWLDPAALCRGEGATVFQVLQQGLASPEHAQFVARLKQAEASI